jgi:hypothetical protein
MRSQATEGVLTTIDTEDGRDDAVIRLDGLVGCEGLIRGAIGPSSGYARAQ